MNQLIPFVYILESPSAKDFLQDKKLGTPLAESLKIINIPYCHKVVTQKREFDICLELDFINKAIYQQTRLYNFLNSELEGKRYLLPIIHFSLHGFEGSGEFVLTSREKIEWEDISQKLLDLKNHVGFLMVCTDSCYGAEAKNTFKIQKSLLKSTFFIGNKEAVDYDNALVGYIVFYHNLLKRLVKVNVPEDTSKNLLKEAKEEIKSHIQESFEIMIAASGDDAFEFNDGSLEDFQIGSFGITTMGEISKRR